MYTVLLYGSEKDTQTAAILLAAIRAAGCSALHLTDRSLSLIPPNAEKPEFLVIESAKAPELQVGRVILVFKQDISLIRHETDIPNDYIAVLDSENPAAIKMLDKSSAQAVTCGLSQKDTVTFSSIEPESAVVWVQRELKTLSGAAIEPMELPVGLNREYGGYPLLAAITVLLLCGVSLPEKEFRLPIPF